MISISPLPVKCPIGGCNYKMCSNVILFHYFQVHNEDVDVKVQEIYLDKKSNLIFKPSTLKWNESVCLGLLAYGGDGNKSCSRPAVRGISSYNGYLPENYTKLNAHLPIFIMACLTTWQNMLCEENFLTTEDRPLDDLIVLWLASEVTTKPFHCTLTACDSLMTCSTSAILKVRNLNKSQNPMDFILGSNCLTLTHGEINNLSQNRQECIKLEIFVNENN